MNTWIKISLKNIKLHWKHSLGAVISIASGFISLCMFQGYMDDVGRLYVDTFSKAKMFGDIIIEEKSFRSIAGKESPLKHSLTLESQIKIEQYFNSHPHQVKVYSRFLNLSGMISNGNENTIFEGRGYDLDKGALLREESWAWDTMYGIPLHINKSPDSMVLGFNLAKLLSCKEEKTEKFYDPTGGFKAVDRPFSCKNSLMQLSVTTENEQMNALDLNVSGFIDASYKEIDNKFLQVSLENAQMLMDTKKISYYTLRLADGVESDVFIRDFIQYAKEQGLDVDAKLWTNHPIGDMYNRTMELLTIFRNFIVIVILFIAGLSIFNTMIKIVRERTREIGTLRSLGFSQGIVTAIFMYESFFLGCFGILGGMIISLVSGTLINLLGITYKAGVLTQPVLFRIQSGVTLYCISGIVLLILTLLTSYIATRQTTKKKIIDCLTHA